MISGVIVNALGVNGQAIESGVHFYFSLRTYVTPLFKFGDFL